MRYGCLVCVFAAILAGTFVALSYAATYKDSPGETYPDTVELAVGSSINISCRLNPEMLPGLTAADLQFIDERTGSPVPQEHLSIESDTTIVYLLRNAVEQDTRYFCQYKSSVIAYTKVTVGTPPTPVDKLSCHSYDFDYMNCTFELPVNAMPTRANLSYTLEYARSYQHFPVCSYADKPLVVCKTTVHQQAFVEHYERFMYQLTLSNTLGTLQQNFTVDNFGGMKLAPPGVDFRERNLYTDAVQVSWNIPKWETYRVRGLEWEVLLRPAHFPQLNLSSNATVVRKHNEMQMHIEKLPFAYYWYDLSLRVRLNCSERWSEPFTHTFRTAPRLPDRGPHITEGSFYLDTSGMRIRLYWEQMALHEQNGYNFGYRVTDVRINGTRQTKKFFEDDSYSASYPWWLWDTKYEVAISSHNHIGYSPNASRITIMPVNQSTIKTHVPRVIHSVYHGTNRSYTLTWKAPIETAGLKDYTVYWCHSKTAVQNECNGSLHFKTVQLGTYTFNTEPQTLQSEHALALAVSANYNGFNTGMHWTSCTGDLNSNLMKLEPEVNAFTATTISVKWIPNICPVLLAGYNLTYCEVAQSAENLECLLEPYSVSIDKNSKKYDITELKPYTLYRVQMVMYNGQRAGKPSDPVLVRTKESAPSPPRELHVTSRTATSATIKWLPPSQMNGILIYYELVLNNDIIRVPVEGDPSAEMVYVCTNLKSYTLYKVYVRAHTVESSKRSNDREFTTLIGFPEKPRNVTSVRDTSNEAHIEWNEPAHRNGRLDFYEVMVKQLRNGTAIKTRISTIVGSNSCALKIPVCIDESHEIIVDVRAVNAAHISQEVIEEEQVLEQDSEECGIREHHACSEELSCVPTRPQNASLVQSYYNASTYRLFRSQWQQGHTYGCTASHLSTIVLSFLLVGTACITLVACFRFGRQKYKRMANINCTLPSGLAYITKEGFGSTFMHGDGTPNERTNKEYVYHNEKHHLLKQEEPNFVLRHSESSFDSALASEDSEHIELLDDSGSAHHSTYVNTNTPNNGYVKAPNNDTCHVDYKQTAEPSTTPSSGYVSVESMQSTIPQSGYVAVGQLRNQDNTRLHTIAPTGYTTLDALKSEACGPVNADIISGYVTQGELTAFGQFQHRN